MNCISCKKDVATHFEPQVNSVIPKCDMCGTPKLYRTCSFLVKRPDNMLLVLLTDNSIRLPRIENDTKHPSDANAILSFGSSFNMKFSSNIPLRNVVKIESKLHSLYAPIWESGIPKNKNNKSTSFITWRYKEEITDELSKLLLVETELFNRLK